MKRTSLILFLTIFAFSNVYGQEHNEVSQGKKEPNSYISIFEIPATDIKRAINFYETILDIDIEHMKMTEMEMGLLPYETNRFLVSL